MSEREGFELAITPGPDLAALSDLSTSDHKYWGPEKSGDQRTNLRPAVGRPVL